MTLRPYLNIGERGTLMVIAADRKQARTVMRYIRGLLQIPALAKMVDNERAESFDLNNMVTIEVHTASYANTRGYSVLAALVDEIAFTGGDDNALSPTELLRALRPCNGDDPERHVNLRQFAICEKRPVVEGLRKALRQG